MSETLGKLSISDLRTVLAQYPVLESQFLVISPCERGDVAGTVEALRAKSKQTYTTFRGPNGKPTPAAQAAADALDALLLLSAVSRARAR